MSDFELINKAASRIYPTHLKEADGASFSWSSMLPADAKKKLIDSQSHIEKNNAGTRSLTHKLKDGGVLEFNLTKHGKSHIAVAKYQNKGKVFSAIHSHDDPKAALTTAYSSISRRMVKEEVEPLLVEKMAKRIEKKTGKISDKKEKIDTNPTDPESIKEGQDSTYDTQAGWSPDLVFHDKKLPHIGGDLTAKEHYDLHHVHSSARLRAIGDSQLTSDPEKKSHYKSVAEEHGKLAKKHAHIYNEMSKHFYKELRNHPNPAVRARMEKFKGDGAILKEEQLDELSQKALGRYVQSAISDRAWRNHEIGYINGIATSVGTTPAERQERDAQNNKAMKRQIGLHRALKKIAPEAMKESEYDQLDELSAKTLGNYIGHASIHGRADSYMAGAHHAIGRMSSNGTPDEHYMKQGDKEKAKSKKRHNGIIMATDKLVRKASVNEELDHEHPDMKAYYAAAKATDEAHLKSIRYRMHNDIKQPEHRKKYDELEKEHHRLRDLEDIAVEKVHGKLLAHHLAPGLVKEEKLNEVEDHFAKIPKGLEWELHHERGFRGSVRSYRSKNGEWEVRPYHTTDYKMEGRLRSVGGTMHKFYAEIRHKDDPIPHIKSFGSVRGENASKVDEKAEKMHAALLKKIPNADKYHTNY